MDCQDWTTVIVKKRPTLYDSKMKGNVKIVANNTKSTQEQQRFAKMDADDYVPVKQKQIDRAELVSRRLLLKLSQVQLDNACSFPKNTVGSFEANRRPPTPAELNILNRVLKCGLKFI